MSPSPDRVAPFSVVDLDALIQDCRRSLTPGRIPGWHAVTMHPEDVLALVAVAKAAQVFTDYPSLIYHTPSPCPACDLEEALKHVR